MVSTKVDYTAKTVYDSKDKLVKNTKDQEDDLFNKIFLTMIKEKKVSGIDIDKDQYLKESIHPINSKMINYEKSYDFKSTAVNHLSYLNEINNFQLSHQVASIEYSRNAISMQKNTMENFSIDKKPVDKSIQLVNFFDQKGFKVEMSTNNKDLIDPTKFLGVSPNFFKKNILITKSELFIRSSSEDYTELLENIQRQLPNSIDRIWLNGKIIWSKI